MNLREIYLRERLRQVQEGQVRVEETPALYCLSEILALKDRIAEELREIHSAKLTFPGQRIIQEGPEKPLDRAN